MDTHIHSFARLLQSISTHNCIRQGRQLHLLFLKLGVLSSSLTTTNRLLQMYSRCGNMGDARKVFDEMTQRNFFTWNVMIEGYMKMGSKKESLELFRSMPEKNGYSWNMVIPGFVKAGELEVASVLFNEMPMKNGTAWSSMIHGYVKCGYWREAFRLFKELNSSPYEVSGADEFVLATIVGACSDLLALDWGKQIHSNIVAKGVEFDSVLASSLINMYAKCGDLDCARNVLNLWQDPDEFCLSALISGYSNCGRLDDARMVFKMKCGPCVGVWNAMISGYVANDKAMEAFILLNDMLRNEIQADSSTFASVLGACSGLGVLEIGEQIHAHTCKFGVIADVVVASALIDTYAKCGSPNNSCKLFSETKNHDTILLNSMITIYSSCGRVKDAKQVFDAMPTKSLVSWNAMTVGLSQNGYPVEALELLCNMNKMGTSMDKFSLTSAISSCASITSIKLGEQFFARAVVTGLEFDHIVATSLVDFYCRCGFVKLGRKLFDQIIKYDVVSWNSMLMGYATNGYGVEALNLFHEMTSAGFVPTDVTFIAVLSACDHCGLLEEGQKWFYAMKHDYHIDPGIEHYSSMVDLFARAGCLEEAMNLIHQMPFEPDASMWSSVLRGCAAHRDETLGKKVVKCIIEVDPRNADAYVQLASIFATSGEWERSAEVRKLMKTMNLQKNPGCSWANDFQNVLMVA